MGNNGFSRERAASASSPRAVLSAAVSLLFLSFSGSCALVQPLTAEDARVHDDQLRLFELNLIHWNILSGRYDAVRPVAPMALPRDDHLLSDVAGLNALFHLAFEILTAERPESPAGPASTPPSSRIVNEEGIARIVTIVIDRGDVDPPPYVHGLLLTENGWVLTVRHPFAYEPYSPDQVSLRLPGSEEGFPMIESYSDSSHNIMLARFEMDGFDGIPGRAAVPPAFSVARLHETAFLPRNGDAVPFVVSETGVALMLGSSLVLEGNFISGAPDSIETVISGTPVWNRYGQVIGLYYHRSIDGSTVGFAGFSDLPRQIGLIVFDFHQKLKRTRR